LKRPNLRRLSTINSNGERGKKTRLVEFKAKRKGCISTISFARRTYSSSMYFLLLVSKIDVARVR